MGNVTCDRCGTQFSWDEYNSHLHDEGVSFDDGCVYANSRCVISGIWAWDRDDPKGNPHGHEFPAYWVRKNQPDVVPSTRDSRPAPAASAWGRAAAGRVQPHANRRTAA